MYEFIIDLQGHAFLQHALAAGVLASLSAGVVGTFVVVRRISYVAGGIAHTVLAGLGAALYLGKAGYWPGLDPLYGAVVAALFAAVVIGMVSIHAQEREDTVIGALWAVGMAVGILFISQTPGYNTDLMSYLFGNILMVSRQDLWLILSLDALVLGLTILFYNQFVAVCFDSEFAQLRGLRVQLFYILLLCLTALTVVVLTTAVGIVLVIALLTLPAAISGSYCKSMRSMMIVSALLCMFFTTSGLVLSYRPDYPAGTRPRADCASALLRHRITKSSA